jgi:hypothetical protein
VSLEKREAEQIIARLLKTFDDIGALKERDEFLNFRRRLRLYASSQEEPYLSHMRDTIERLPGYSRWLMAAEAYGSAGECDQLLEILKDMIPMPVFSSLQEE